MTTEPPEPYEPEPSDPDEFIEYEGPVDSDQLDFSTGEGMVALGGAIIALVYVLELFLSDYEIHATGLVIAIVVVGLPRMDRELVEKVAPLPVLMKLGGYLLGVAGGIQILSDLSEGSLDAFVAAIAAISAYAGYAIAFLGARSIKT